MYTVAEKNLEDNTFDLKTIDEVKEMASSHGGFARTKWCGSLECELKMKEQSRAFPPAACPSSRAAPPASASAAAKSALLIFIGALPIKYQLSIE